MKKKTWKKLIIGLLLTLVGVVVLAFITHASMTFYYKKKSIKEDKSFELVKNTRYIADSMELVKVLEAKNIEIDEEYKQLLIDRGLEIVRGYKHTDIQGMTLGEIIYINENCNGGKNDELLELLDEYYNEEKMLFTDLLYENYNPEIVELEENMWVVETIEIARKLYNNEEIMSKYNIMEGLAEWFNNNINESNDENESELEMIFWLFYTLDMLDLIDYSGIEKVMEQDRIYEKEIIDEDNLEASLTTIIYADGVSDYQQLFHNDKSYLGLVDTLFSEISTLEQLEYQKDATYCMYFLSEVIKCIERPQDNSFFVSVINECLKENYNYVFSEE